MIKETMQIVLATLRDYRGASLYFSLYLLALIYLFVTEKEKNKRILLLYLAGVIVGIFVFPPTAYVVMHHVMDTEIYYRQLWMIPYGVTICYAVIKIMISIPNRVGKELVAVTAVLIMIVTGTNVFRNGNYSRAENAYHIPQEVIEICDFILDDDIEYTPTAAFPLLLVEYTRQYTAQITTVYGREAIIDRWNLPNELLALIESERLSAEALTTVGREQGAECIVVNAAKAMDGRMEDYGFCLIGTVEGYDIYMETWLALRHNGFVLPEE